MCFLYTNINEMLKTSQSQKGRSLLERNNNNSGSYIRPTTQSPVGSYLLIKHRHLLARGWLFLTYKNKADVGHFRSCIHL